jgi:NAD+ diphosphatase
MYYSGLGLDRAAAARSDQEWIAKLIGDDSTRVIPLWRDQCLVRDGAPVTLSGGDAAELLAAAADPVFLGVDAGSAFFAADLSVLEQPSVIGLAGAHSSAGLPGLIPGVSARWPVSLRSGKVWRTRFAAKSPRKLG